MHHLEAERAAAHLAEAAQPRAAREPLLLAGREVEEPQRQHPRAVGDAREELAAAAVGDLGELDLALDRGTRSALERADGGELRAILVTQRQHEQQIRHAPDGKTRQALGERRAHAAERGDWAVLGSLGRGRPALRPWPGAQGRCRTHSISTCAPRGSAATPTTARAG